MLRREHNRRALDQIFGKGAYDVESDERDAACVRSRQLEWRIGYDRRDGSLASSLTAAPQEEWSESAVPETWARFLGDEVPPLPRDAVGMVELSVDEQIALELALLQRLSLSIFADAQRTRDAAFFVRGYQRAYTDYCSGRWEVS